MRVLGVDTASAHASAAIVENGRIIAEKTQPSDASLAAGVGGSRNNHAEVLLPLIDSALHAVALTLNDVGGYAVAIGPGSFTGLRIGLSTVQGLSYGSGIPVAGVSTLHAIALRMCDLDGVICPVLDARKKEVYAALFRCNTGVLERLSDDSVLSYEQLGERLRQLDPSESIVLAGDGASVYGGQLVGSIGPHVRIGLEERRPTIAAAVALLGESNLINGTAPRDASLAPHYLHAARAELMPAKGGVTH
jgi:tRNA threonylcarbamoyladenosine biosynthesis protein TsaB